MSKRAIKLWAIVVTIFTLGIVATYVILGNNGSSVSNNVSSNATQENANTSNILPSQESLEDTEQGQGSGDYYYWSIMPLRLQSKLPNPRSSAVLDYYYSKELGIAFSYEVVSLVDKNKFLTISVPEQGSNDNKIYLHNFEESKESGQSIEVINIEDNFRFSTIAEIISLQLLDEKQRISCKVD